MEKRLQLIHDTQTFLEVLQDTTTSSACIKDRMLALLKNDVQIPATIYQKYLARYLKEHIHGMRLQEGVAGHCKALAATLSPLAGTNTGEVVAGEAAFDFDKPTIWSLDLPLDRKRALCVRTLSYDVFGSLIGGGEDLSLVCYYFVTSMHELLEDQVEMCEDVDPIVDDLMQVCRALKSLVGVSDFSVDYEAVKRMKIYMERREIDEGFFGDVALLLAKSDWYTDLVKEFISTMCESKQYLPALAKKHEILTSPLPNSEYVVEVDTAMDLLSEVRGVLRRGATKELTMAVQDLLMKPEMWTWGTEDALATREAPFHGASPVGVGLLDKACKLWPDSIDLQALKEKSIAAAQETIREGNAAKLRVVLQKMREKTGDEFHAYWEEQVLAAVALCRGIGFGNGEPGLVPAIEHCLNQLEECFPAQLDKVEEAKGLLNFVDKREDYDKLEIKRGTLWLSMRLHEAVQEYGLLGDDEATRAEADKDYKGISAVLRTKKALTHHFYPSGQGNPSDKADFVTELWDTSEQLVEGAWKSVTTLVSEALAKEVARVSPWAAGGHAGGLWYANLGPSSTLAEFLQEGQETLLKRGPSKFDDAVDALKGVCKSYESAFTVFEKEIEANKLEEAQRCIERLQISSCEGLLCKLFLGEKDDRLAVKRAVHAIQKRFGDSFAQVHAVLRERASMALKLQ